MLLRVDVISVTRGWLGVQFPEKKHYVTLEWPPKQYHLVGSKYVRRQNKHRRNKYRRRINIESYIYVDRENVQRSNMQIAIIGKRTTGISVKSEMDRVGIVWKLDVLTRQTHVQHHSQ